MSGPLGNLPGSRNPFWDRLVRGLASFWDNQQRVEILGILPSGNDTIVRFRASRATKFVRVHVQSTSTYDKYSYVLDERIDCRTNRQRDYTVEGNAERYVWLVPEFKHPDGTFVRYDGENGNGEDLMAFTSVGNAKVAKDIRDELHLIRRLLERQLIHTAATTGIKKLGPITKDEA